ncbi:MAG: hypothetical protein GPJ50_12765, partial [Candidatus Heimdallarchaeota archaeon]|nr:hypothetical protein [Candidatus Heimdallarchaeota archaeon]
EAHEDENGDCYTELNKEGRKFANEGIGYVQNLSQCKYHYIANEGEDNEIIRKVSLFHYTYIWPVGGRDEVLKVVNHKNVADFEIRIPIVIPPGGVADITGTFSKDLTKLYVSIFQMIGYMPPSERYLSYYIYSLEKIDGENSWALIKSGYTPKGMTYLDNLVTRDGKCGCWKSGVETSEEYTQAGTLQKVDCWGSGGSSYKNGKRAKVEYKTFSLITEEFLVHDRMEAFHMSVYLKDYAVCKASESFSYEGAGGPCSFKDWDCACKCNKCGFGESSLFDRRIREENQTGGESNKYSLFNGLESLEPDWENFWTCDVYHLYESHFHLTQNCGHPGHPTGYGKSRWFNSQGFQVLRHANTICVYRDVEDSEKISISEGNCGHDGSSTGLFGAGVCQKVYASWLCNLGAGAQLNCNEDVYIHPDVWTNVKEQKILSPIEMTMHYDETTGVWESIGRSFVSYDEETDSLIRGIRYKALDGKWYWYIRAKIPIRDDEEPFSVIKDCKDKKIDQELKLLLSDERFSRLEAIIFVEDIKEK